MNINQSNGFFLEINFLPSSYGSTLFITVIFGEALL